ncbi:hypothetical protein PHOSAC3_150196 [Mesotoga infera]|nr:hypothetical protein PHOSAC3_150196 [Mesotoga infera]
MITEAYEKTQRDEKSDSFKDLCDVFHIFALLFDDVDTH